MIDENAFGLFVSYFDVEEDEYALEPEDFVRRVGRFRATVIECLEALPLGKDARAIDFGHGVYVEIADGDQTEDPMAWLKMVRARLQGREFRTAALLTHGSRWVEGEAPFSSEFAGDVGLATVSPPSEPLRRALYGDAATRTDDEHDGWGPGLYLDTEAVEALGRTPKNAPTVLSASGAGFYRAGK